MTTTECVNNNFLKRVSWKEKGSLNLAVKEMKK